MKTNVIIILASVCAMLGFSGCATNPVTGERELMIFTHEEEVALGAQASTQIEEEMGQSLSDKQVQGYIDSVGQNIARISHTPDLEFHYKAIEHDSVNAFALPGGYLYITTGMLKELRSEAQMASILAHETVHVTARHSAACMSRQMLIDLGLSLLDNEKTQGIAKVGQLATQLEGLQYSKEHERQADKYGLEYLVKAGYNAHAMVETMEMLQRQGGARGFEFLSTHPDPENRVEYPKEAIRDKNYGSGGVTGEEQYRRYVLDKLYPN